MHHKSPPKNSLNKKFRYRCGTFVDLNDDKGPRFLLTDEEIEYIRKAFFLMQLARDDFIVKYSILNNLSPERLQLRMKEAEAADKLFKPQFCEKSKKIIDKATV